jgi:uncharacterized protein with FMN-binding domain
MRRAIPVIAVTAGGLALVANFHTKPSGVRLASGNSPGRPVPSTSTTDSPTTSPPSTARRSAVPTTTVKPAANRKVDGPVITTDYGDVQVEVTLSGSRITDVQALQLPSDRSRSVRISQYAGPQLRSEALQAQSAQIDLVSGASYTSQGYIESLQGALDQAGR